MIFRARSDEYLHGRLYKHYPTIENAEKNVTSGLAFRYKVVSKITKEEARIATNGEIDSAMQTIETSFPLPWESKSYVLLDRGSLWQIKSVGVDTDRNTQAARYAKAPDKYALVLFEVEEPLGLTV